MLVMCVICVCVRVCARVCVCARVRVCVRVCVHLLRSLLGTFTRIHTSKLRTTLTIEDILMVLICLTI